MFPTDWFIYFTETCFCVVLPVISRKSLKLVSFSYKTLISKSLAVLYYVFINNQKGLVKTVPRRCSIKKALKNHREDLRRSYFPFKATGCKPANC